MVSTDVLRDENKRYVFRQSIYADLTILLTTDTQVLIY